MKLTQEPAVLVAELYLIWHQPEPTEGCGSSGALAMHCWELHHKRVGVELTIDATGRVPC